MDQLADLINRIGPHWIAVIAALMVAHRFLNNLAANIPAIKGNTYFQVLCGVLNAVIETQQGKGGGEPEKPTDPN